MDQVDYLRERVISETDILKLRLFIADLIAGGADREKVLSNLDRIRAELRVSDASNHQKCRSAIDIQLIPGLRLIGPIL
jgi:hypothetical protein